MAPVSLKERMKQLQELKTSVQAKSEAVSEREKELGEIANTSPTDDAGATKLQLETQQDDQTAGGETQTTAGETEASPPAPSTEEAEDASKTESSPPSTLAQVDEAPAEEVKAEGGAGEEKAEEADEAKVDEVKAAEADEVKTEEANEVPVAAAVTSTEHEEEYEGTFLNLLRDNVVSPKFSPIVSSGCYRGGRGSSGGGWRRSGDNRRSRRSGGRYRRC
jgi:hypothetical protein